MISETELVNIVYDFKKRGANSAQLSFLFDRLKNGQDPSSVCIDKILSIINNIYKEERNLRGEVRAWVQNTNGGIFTISESYLELEAKTKQDKDNVRKTISDLAKERVIEKATGRNGAYRLISTEKVEEDYKDVDMNSKVNFTLPLSVHLKTVIFPKSVIVIAGVTGTGKTTYILNMIKDNMHKHQIHYFNCELSAQALHYKLNQFNFPVKDWTFKHYVDVTNYADVLVPDDINVIDYLQPPSDKAYSVRDQIYAIKKKLNKGIAIVALQKKPGNRFGEGGEYGAHGAHLYINLEWGRLEVAKNSFQELDKFRGLSFRDFDINHGEVQHRGGWYSEDTKKKDEKVKSYGHLGVVDSRRREPGDDDFSHED